MASIIKVNTIQDATNSNTALSIDSTGRITEPNKPAFQIQYNSQNSLDFSSGVALSGTAYYNSSTLQEQGGSNFDISTGHYVMPVSGFYFFHVGIRLDNFAGSYIYITLDGTKQIGRYLSSVQSTYINPTVSAAAQFTAGQHVRVRINSVGDSSVNMNADSYFQGFLIG